jgi:hypothetical protein
MVADRREQSSDGSIPAVMPTPENGRHTGGEPPGVAGGDGETIAPAVRQALRGEGERVRDRALRGRASLDGRRPASVNGS